MKLIRFEAVVDVVAVAEDKDGRPKHFAIKEIQPFVIASDEFLFNLLFELGDAGKEAYFRCDFEKVQAELDGRLAEWQAYLDSLAAEPDWSGAALEEGDTRIILEHIGEGYSGDYDEEDPDDERMIRFTLSFRDEDTGDWVDADDGSYCTNIPLSATPEQKDRALRILMSNLGGRRIGYKRVAEELSWLGLKDLT